MEDYSDMYEEKYEEGMNDYFMNTYDIMRSQMGMDSEFLYDEDTESIEFQEQFYKKKIKRESLVGEVEKDLKFLENSRRTYCFEYCDCEYECIPLGFNSDKTKIIMEDSSTKNVSFFSVYKIGNEILIKGFRIM